MNGTLWANLGLAPFDRLQVIGCGTSLNAGHVIGNVVRRLGGLPVRQRRQRSREDIVEPRTLCLAISQSGETAMFCMLSHPDDGGAAPAGPYQQFAFHVGPPRRRGHDLCGRSGDRRGSHENFCVPDHCRGGGDGFGACRYVSVLRDAAANLVDELRRIPDQLAAAGTVAKSVVPPIAEELMTASGVVFIARGSGLPYAAEGALKLKELTYRWAEHYPAGELKHGPLALIGTGTPVVVVDNGDPKLATNVAEVQARGGRIISIGSVGSTVPVLDNLAAPWGPLEAAIPLQILARTLALALGRDVDKPRNLAKSVTVE